MSGFTRVLADLIPAASFDHLIHVQQGPGMVQEVDAVCAAKVLPDGVQSDIPSPVLVSRMWRPLESTQQYLGGDVPSRPQTLPPGVKLAGLDDGDAAAYQATISELRAQSDNYGGQLILWDEKKLLQKIANFGPGLLNKIKRLLSQNRLGLNTNRKAVESVIPEARGYRIPDYSFVTLVFIAKSV